MVNISSGRKVDVKSPHGLFTCRKRIDNKERLNTWRLSALRRASEGPVHARKRLQATAVGPSK